MIFPAIYLKADHFEKIIEQGGGPFKNAEGRGVSKTKNVKKYKNKFFSDFFFIKQIDMKYSIVLLTFELIMMTTTVHWAKSLAEISNYMGHNR